MAKMCVCEPWAFDEIINSIVSSDGSLKLDRDKFNRLMLQSGKRMVSHEFYVYFFPDVKTIEAFEAAVDRFRAKAMWLFGNFKYAFRILAAGDRDEFTRHIEKTHSVDPETYADREPFLEIQSIAVEDLYLLGYLSREELKDLDFAFEAIETLANKPDSVVSSLEAIGSANQKKIADLLSKHGLTFPAEGHEGLNAHSLNEFRDKLAKLVETSKLRTEKATETGKKNTQRYLGLPYLDVYVATSMRYEMDFKEQHAFIREVFEHPDVKPLKLRYFDPTLSFVDDPVTKGLIECLMLRRARVTIYNAGKEDTFGKDSELASTLAQGKSVIVFVPPNLDKRAKMFKIDHPLGLQIDVRTGVAHGLIVVRSTDECAQMLRKVILNQLELEILHEGGNFKLREKQTGSILRVVTDDPYLTHAFWTYFHKIPL